MDDPARLRSGLRALAMLLLLVLLAGVVDGPVVACYRISGHSMEPAFEDGDRVLVSAVPALAGGLHLGDAVIARLDGEVLIKRIVGRPGDRLELVRGTLYRNGRPVAEPIPPTLRDQDSFPALELLPDEFFIMGDHRRVSVDSRVFGPLRRDAIVGKVVYRIHSGEGRTAVAAGEGR